MGHLLSKESRNRPNQKRPRCCSWCRRRRPLLRLPRRTPAKAPPQPAAPRSRDCFFRGPCMLCFIVHSPGAPAPAGPEEEPPLSPPPRDGAYAAAASPQHLARRCAALAAEDCAAAARRFLLSSAAAAAAAAASASSPAACCRELGLAAAAAWEQQGRSLFLASVGPVRFLGPPVAVQLFRGPPPADPPTPPEMVCKRKGAGVPACTPCKQPRCGGGGSGGGGPAGGGASPPRPPDAGGCPGSEQPPQPLCPPPSSPTSEGAPAEAGGDAVRVGSAAPSPAQHDCGDADCQDPHGNPCDCPREPPPETPDINQLPPSILLKIFSNLSLDERCLSASLVCKYWRDLCLDFQFWKQLDLSSRQQVTDELLEKIASRSQNIIEINISDCRSMSDTGVCVLAFKCPGLLRYTAYRCKQLSDTSIIAVASHCPLLQKVHVGNQDKLTDEGLKQLGSKCRELKDIHFGQCYKISDEGMIVIAKGCLKLQRIYMQENKLIKIHYLCHLGFHQVILSSVYAPIQATCLVTDQSVKAFAEHCPELRYVGFMGCSVTSKGVIHLTKLRNLSSLDLRHITELDNETVMEIVKRCKNLSSLNLCLNWIINDRCVEVIAKEGQNLKELYLVSCKITDYALIAIGRYSMTIETVDVGWCKEITDQGATLIAQSSKSLRYLGLMRCDKVNEVTVEQLVQQYPHITFSTVLQDCKRTLERAYQMGWTPNMSAASS
ncbi:F-box/LRR-repeat protein 17 isoform X1 [Phyllostomus hastatus]|uniref:F-box/LRR-repeat protein 17 isoform X1 n=1 Tax=Phyllostomus hastatus TaxID=9423 RepID=UPI001E67E87B|nr:F-box/LRR-repeat protein 17 isoform X1 [Phyllostomus hastatus]